MTQQINISSQQMLICRNNQVCLHGIFPYDNIKVMTTYMCCVNDVLLIMYWAMFSFRVVLHIKYCICQKYSHYEIAIYLTYYDISLCACEV